MEAEFWHERWAEKEIGFHQSETHRFLKQYWGNLKLLKDSTVLVPLCGKSMDMLWLAQLGHRVIGVELSEVAAQEFFEESQIAPVIEQHGPFKSYQAQNVEILVGDFFALTATDIAQVAGVYDRAALVALPPAMRQDYVAKLKALLPSQTQSLVVTFEYRPGEADGPPFSIDPAAVNELFDGSCEISKLDSQYFDLRGIDTTEHAFHIVYR